jgi:hypothetical protein
MKGLLVSALGIGLAVGLTLVSGVIHGRMTNRWGPPPGTAAAAERLAGFPQELGNWKLHSTQELDVFAAEMLECVESVCGTYVNQATGDLVDLVVLLGRPGPIAVHTPEVCVSSRDYRLQGSRLPITIRDQDGADHTFWAVTFRSNGVDADVLEMCYGWSTGGCWSATTDPRYVYAGQPYLYKVQVSTTLRPGVDPQTSDCCQEFLQDFVAAAKDRLIEPPRRR